MPPIAHQEHEYPQGMLAGQVHHDGHWALSSRHLWGSMSDQDRPVSSHSHSVQPHDGPWVLSWRHLWRPMSDQDRPVPSHSHSVQSHDGPWVLSWRHLWRPMSDQDRPVPSHSHSVQSHDGPWVLSWRHLWLWRPMSDQDRPVPSHSHSVQSHQLLDSTWPQSGPTSLGPTVGEAGGVRNLEIINNLYIEYVSHWEQGFCYIKIPVEIDFECRGTQACTKALASLLVLSTSMQKFGTFSQKRKFPFIKTYANFNKIWIEREESL